MDSADAFVGLTFHHIGLLVSDLKASVSHYSDLFGKHAASDILYIHSQNVNVSFVKNADNSFIELIEPAGENSVVYKLLKKGITYYHLAYKVDDIEGSVKRLEQLHYKTLEYFTSEAYPGKKCIFLFSPEAHLIELIEK